MYFVTVGQSVMWAIVMVSSLFSPLHGLVVGEGIFSLNHHLRSYRCHLNYSNQMVDHRLRLVYTFLSLDFHEDPQDAL